MHKNNMIKKSPFIPLWQSRRSVLGGVRGDFIKINNSLSYILLAILTVTISGCTLHKSSIKDSQIAVPPSYTTEAQKAADLSSRWWEKFHDETLNKLMEAAFSNNLDIMQAYERLQQSLSRIRITDSSRGINANIEGSGGKIRQSSAFGIVRKDTYSLSAAAAYEIDLWGKLKSTTNAAQLDALASEEDLKALYISISAQITDLYYLAVEQRAQLDLSEQTISSFQDTLDRVERRYREGLVPALDVYQSRQNLSSAKAQKPLFESSLAVTLNSISVLTGNFPDKKIGGSADELINAPAFNEGIPSQLLTERPDIRSAYLKLEASDERIAAAIADRFPSFNIAGTYGGTSDKVRTILDSPNIFWNILLKAAMPVLDAGRRKAEVDRTKAVFREKLAAYHQAVLNAFKEVEDALAKSGASEERITMLKDTVAASENSYRLALDNYMQGLTDYLPVLTEQLRHFTAKSNLLSAKRQLISDRIQLARALGGAWTNKIIKRETQYEHAINTGEENK
jgi:NodT family efflux transporter outer membrane factor (OMF) lipoprotein